MTEPSREALLAQERAEYDVRYDDTDIQAPLREHIVPPVERALWNKYMGDLAGKTVLECGAGDGAIAVWLAAQQAKVVAVELSPVGCERIRQRAAYHGLGERVQVYCGDCCRLETMLAENSIDVAFGSAVLHHFPPLDFGASLKQVLKPGAYGLFLENSNANPLYRLGRKIRNNETACGSPLTAEQADTLIATLGGGAKIYPRFGLFSFIPKYVLRESAAFKQFMRDIDAAIDTIPATRRWSAHMWVYVRKPNLETMSG